MSTKKSACTPASKSKHAKSSSVTGAGNDQVLRQMIDESIDSGFLHSENKPYWIKQTPETLSQFLRAKGCKTDEASTFVPLPKLKFGKVTTQGSQAKAALIGLLHSIPDEDFTGALEDLQERWTKGVQVGIERGFGLGWDEGCEKIQGCRQNHNYKFELPPDYQAPAWPGAMRETGTLDFMACLLGLQVLKNGNGAKGNQVINARASALDRVQSIAMNIGEKQGKKLGFCISAVHSIPSAEHPTELAVD